EQGVDATDLEQEFSEIQRRIELHDPEFASLKVVAPITLEEVRAKLPQHTALVEYFEGLNEILVFVVTRAVVELKKIPRSMRQLASAFNRQGRLRDLSADALGHTQIPWALTKLYDDLITPIMPYLSDVKQLIIVPHGLLHYIPFHALWDQSTGMF